MRAEADSRLAARITLAIEDHLEAIRAILDDTDVELGSLIRAWRRRRLLPDSGAEAVLIARDLDASMAECAAAFHAFRERLERDALREGVRMPTAWPQRRERPAGQRGPGRPPKYDTRVLALLATEGPLTAAAIADDLGEPRMACMAAVRKMVSRGLLVRQRTKGRDVYRLP